VNFDNVIHAPLWMQVLIVGSAAWSTFQLLAFDKILTRWRVRYLKMGEWREEDDPKHENVPEDYEWDRALFLTCPYCAGFWIWLLWLFAWFLTSWTLIPALALGGRTMVVAGHKLLAKDEDK
jgi:hypothetical protein